MGCVYMIKNEINGKCYIGQCRRDVEARKKEHLSGNGNRLLKQDIEKYGGKVFSFHVLKDGIIPELLNSYEVETIAKYDCVSPKGYNLTNGGGAKKKYSNETRRKISKALKGRKRPPEVIRKISEANKGKNNPNYGKPRSLETRLKMSKSHTGKKHSLERRKRNSEVRKGKKLPKETRLKMSESHKGKNNPNYGKTLPPEQRRKISESLKGKNNPNYGKKHSKETIRRMSEAQKRCWAKRKQGKSN